MRRLAAIAAMAVLLAGCGGDVQPSAGAGKAVETATRATAAAERDVCAVPVAIVVDAVQGYVGSFGTEQLAEGQTATSPVGSADKPGSEKAASSDEPPADVLSDAVAEAQRVAAKVRCADADLAAGIAEGLETVSADGAVATAVRDRTIATMTGAAAPDLPLTPDDDLSLAVAATESGGVIELGAGTWDLTEPVVLLGGVTLRGAGPERTVLRSSAPEATILVATADRVELRSLALERDRAAVGSVVVGGPSASLVVEDAVLSGAVGDESSGGAGIHMSAQGEQGSGRGTTLEITDSVLRDNGWAGIAVTGGHRASVLGATFEANGQCGICFLGAATGSVEDSTFDGNTVGFYAGDTASPVLTGSTITGGEAGIQVGGTAVAALESTTIRGSGRAAVIYTGQGGGSVTGLVCEQVEHGIAVGPESTPIPGENACTIAFAD
ncbi:right-handed parallel beta-helix repeat-containing protein [Georgenia halophila]|uniref:right-handed parallel beta-helix repeat-containing protein n=1 Tax=Georgenia halophila TaxID=620889 RepID=UPI0031EA0FB6